MPLLNLLSALNGLPLAELHLHLEGSVSDETLARLVRRHEPGSTVTEVDIRAQRSFSDVDGFFQAFMTTLPWLRGPEDYRLIAHECGVELGRQGVEYAEITTSIAGAEWAKRLSADDIIPAIAEGFNAAQREGGPRWALLVDMIRDICAEGQGSVGLDVALRNRKHGVIGIAMGGTECAPATVAREVFAAAERAGLRRTAHAGEQAGPQSVWDALEIGAERIGHGVRAWEEPALVNYLAAHRVPLEMCPTSNLRTGAVVSLEAHPIADALRRNIPVSLSTDDPPLFETNLAREYALVLDAFALSEKEVIRLARNAWETSFLPEEEKTAALERFDATANAVSIS